MSLRKDISTTMRKDKVTLARLDEFVVSPTFYFVYQGYKDKMLLTYLHEIYSTVFPNLNDIHVDRGHLSPYMATTRKKKAKHKEKQDDEDEKGGEELDTDSMNDPKGLDAHEVRELERLGKD